MKSLWHDSAALPSFPQLKKDISTDVLIIGGGIAGILCAFMLKNAGVDYILTEGNTICHGATGNTTAKITSQPGLIYDKLSSRYGEGVARKYYLANEEALKKYRELCRDADCDFCEKDNYIYSLKGTDKLNKEMATLQKIGARAVFTEKCDLPFSVAGAVKFPNQAQFNPLKFLKEIAKDLNIYEHTFIHSFDGNKYVSDSATIKAKKVIVATHFPIFNKHGGFFIKMYQERSYVIALENAKLVEGTYLDENTNGLSFRTCNDFLLIGSGSHKTGKESSGWKEIEAFTRRHYPNAKIRYRWATQDCITLDDMPYIGRYSEKTPDLYVATGFNKWGMTQSMLAATMLSDMVQGKKSEYEEIFTPQRGILHPRLLENAFTSVINLLTPTAPRCPHLGCALKWNKQEHTWDCPCHGSRFAENGKLLSNPATGDMKIKKH